MTSILLQMYEQKTRTLTVEPHVLETIDPSIFSIDNQTVTLKDAYVLGFLMVKNTVSFLKITETEELVIQNENIKDAMDRDIVLVSIELLKVIGIIKRSVVNVVCELKKRKSGLVWFSEKYPKYRIEAKVPKMAVEGHIYLLDIVSIENQVMIANINHLIGHKNDPDIETNKLVATYEWPQTFSDKAMHQLENIHTDFNKERDTRKQFKDHLIVTIDGKDAKDLDDAIELEVRDGHYYITVHIADVSYYVRKGALDDEAYDRATSVYLADRVIPMLPHKLSNDWCSLNPHEEKLALSCSMVLNESLEMVSYEITKSIIESKYRLNYDDVNRLFKGEFTYEDNALNHMLLEMLAVSKKLASMRRKRGELEFKSEELGFKMNALGRVIEIYKRKTGDAEQLIESFMLLANETVAEHMDRHQLPALYRVHERPDVDKLKMTLETIKRLNVEVDFSHIGDFKPLQSVLYHVAHTPVEGVVNMMLLRSMKKAYYSENRDIHYGLGATYYAHFTSPIRRYPDLFLHRMIHEYVIQDMQKSMMHTAQIEEIAKHTSDQERKSIDLERDVDQLKVCEYLEDKMGTKYRGVIMQMMPSGMFVRLDMGIEGFVPLRLLNSYFTFDEVQLMYKNHEGVSYALGQEVMVEVVRVDKVERQIDFKIIEKSRRKGHRHENHSVKQKGAPRLSAGRKNRGGHRSKRK